MDEIKRFKRKHLDSSYPFILEKELTNNVQILSYFFVILRKYSR